MKLNRRTVMLNAPLASALALAGCGGILAKQPYHPRTDWPLAPEPPSVSDHTPHGVVLVRSIDAGPALSQRGLITQLADGSIHRGYYNRWATPPAQAVTASLIAWLQATGNFTAVVAEGSALTPTLIVEGTLDTLLANPSAHIARCTLTLVIAKPQGIGERPIAQRRLQATAPLTDPAAPNLVAAQRAALAGVLAEAVLMVK